MRLANIIAIQRAAADLVAQYEDGRRYLGSPYGTCAALTDAVESIPDMPRYAGYIVGKACLTPGAYRDRQLGPAGVFTPLRYRYLKQLAEECPRVIQELVERPGWGRL